jgi:histidinol-phosphate aminotransferase
MINLKKKHLLKINRIRIPEERDLKYGLRLDRNEKVSNWEEDIYSKIFRNFEGFNLSVYPDLDKIYKKIGKFNKINPKHILLTSGIDGGIRLIFETLLNQKNKIASLHPSYAMYEVYSKIFGMKLIKINFDKDFKIDLKSIDLALKKNVKVLFLPNPNQPVESYFNLKQLEELAKKCLKYECFLFIDEAYYHFGSQTGISLIKKYKNVIVARTFSKGFGVPSIRLGYLMTNIKLIKFLSASRLAHETNALSVKVADYLIDNWHLVKNYNEKVVDAREFVKKELNKININAYGKYGNYLLVDMNNRLQAEKVVKFLKRNKIYVKGPWKEPYQNFFSISVGPKKMMAKFILQIKNFMYS